MRYLCMVTLLTSAIVPAEVFVAGPQQSAGGRQQTTREQPLAEIPEAFRFLFRSYEERARDFANLEELWKGLPYDSISLERGGTGGCLIACRTSTVTLHRATVSGIVIGPLDRSGRMVFGELRGRAELRTVAPPEAALVGLGNLPPPGPQVSESEGSVDVYTFASLSYLLQRARFLDLPNEYDCSGCPADRPYVMLSVTSDGNTKTVVDYGVGRPVDSWAIQQAFDSVSQSIQWTQK